MTLDERARKLADKLMSDARLRQNSPVEIIAAELRAVAIEALADPQTTMKEIVSDWIKKAKSEAYEDAARIVESYDFVGPDHLVAEGRKTLGRITQEIRAKAEEV